VTRAALAARQQPDHQWLLRQYFPRAPDLGKHSTDDSPPSPRPSTADP
jgi:hypothetical protein